MQRTGERPCAPTEASRHLRVLVLVGESLEFRREGFDHDGTSANYISVQMTKSTAVCRTRADDYRSRRGFRPAAAAFPTGRLDEGTSWEAWEAGP